MEQAAATLVVKGKIYTGVSPKEQPKEKQAIAVRKTKIVYCGDESGAQSFISAQTRVISLPDTALLLPGFYDAHCHPMSAGTQLLDTTLNIVSCFDLEHALRVIKEYALQFPDLPWIFGSGSLASWFEGGIALAKYLDEAVPDGRPVTIRCYDGHSVWANTAAMKMAGITKHTPDPPNGRIERDPKTGEPVGHFSEEAYALFDKAKSASTSGKASNANEVNRKIAGMRKAMLELAKHGIVGVQDAAVKLIHLNAYEALKTEKALTVKVTACLECPKDMSEDDFEKEQKFLEWVNQTRNRHTDEENSTNYFRAHNVKFFVDGVIENHTAAMYEPYCGCEDHVDERKRRGFTLFSEARMKRLFAQLDKEGFGIHCHCIGDRATREVLRAFEFVESRRSEKEENGQRGVHQIAHLQVVRPEDVPKLAAFRVGANFQPFWCSPDDDMMELTQPALGPVRSRWQYPVKSVIESGAVVGFGSDWPVSPVNPLHAIQVAVTHGVIGEDDRPAWRPEESITIGEAVYYQTRGAAQLCGRERESGSLEVGKAADFVVLEDDLWQIPPERVSEVEILFTFVDGVQVYSRTKQ